MPVTYTNRKGVTYTLCQGTGKGGKPRYFFAKDSTKGRPCDEVPDGFEISESINGVVSCARVRERLIRDDEAKVVQRLLDEHTKPKKYRLWVRHDRIEIHELMGPTADEFLVHLRRAGFVPDPERLLRALGEDSEAGARYSAVARFWLHDPEERTFRAERVYYLGDGDSWMPFGPTARIEVLAKDIIPRLESDAFFDL